MIRIRLRKKFLYEITNKDRMIEEHYRYTYLDIGYKGQIYFLSILEEDYCIMFVGANMIWHSKF